MLIPILNKNQNNSLSSDLSEERARVRGETLGDNPITRFLLALHPHLASPPSKLGGEGFFWFLNRIGVKSFYRYFVCILLVLLSACNTNPSRQAPAPPIVKAAPSSSLADVANNILFRAIALVGTPYHFGGNTPQSGFDCSGLVGYVFRDVANVVLPRTAKEMSALDKKKIDQPELKSGDLVFFKAHQNVSHVGIYVGEQRFVHAPNEGGTVRLDSLNGAWWREHFAYGKRIIE